MRYLGIDYGTTKLGLAVGDSNTGFVFGRGLLPKTTNEKLFADLKKFIEDEGIEAIVVGLPLALTGAETLTTRQAQNFGDKLKRKFGLPVHFEDERLTSAEAESMLREAGLRGKKIKKVLDAEAAKLILETFLNRQAGE